MIRLLGPIAAALPLGFSGLALIAVCVSAGGAHGQDPVKGQEPTKKFKVNLSEEQVDYSATNQDYSQNQGVNQGVLGRPWFQNFEISGHVALDYLDTGRSGFRPKGSSMFREGRLTIEAQATERISVYVDLEFTRAGQRDDGNIHSREAYLHFREVLESDPGLLNIKIGAVDIPFGEEYLRRYATDNPMINYSAAMPYGLDEGILGYGKYRGISWYAAVMDGTGSKSLDDNNDKAYALKLAGNPFESLYVSASGMRTGNTGVSANCFGGGPLAPVGSFFVQTSAGTSPSKEISATMYELDAKLEFSDSTYLLASFGQAHVDDNAPGFDRDLTWFFLEPSFKITDSVYLALRYSEFGTYDSDKGYLINGKITGAGFGTFGWDAKRLQRIGLTLGYHPHKNLWVKAEVGRDRYWVIDSSPLTPGSDHREYFAFEVVVAF